MSSFVNKVKDTLSGGHPVQDDTADYNNPTMATSQTPTAPKTGAYDSTNAGPHSSNVANKLDPRVDSDRDGSRRVGDTGMGARNVGTQQTTDTGMGARNVGTQQTTDTGMGARNTGAQQTTDTGMGARNIGTQQTTDTHGADTKSGTTAAGPHSSRVENKLDPRVDTHPHGSMDTGDADISGTTGRHGNIGQHQGYGSKHSAGSTGPTTSHGAHQTAPGTGGHQTTPSTAGRTGAGMYTGSGAHQGTTDAHNRTGTTTQAVSGQGPAPNTAGPHKSDLMNKLDPRVDSNLDGSKTIGGDKTHSTGTGKTGGYRTG